MYCSLRHHIRHKIPHKKKIILLDLRSSHYRSRRNTLYKTLLKYIYPSNIGLRFMEYISGVTDLWHVVVGRIAWSLIAGNYFRIVCSRWEYWKDPHAVMTTDWELIVRQYMYIVLIIFYGPFRWLLDWYRSFSVYERKWDLFFSQEITYVVDINQWNRIIFVDKKNLIY